MKLCSFLLLTALFCMASPALAGEPTDDCVTKILPGDAGIFGDAAGTDTFVQATAFVPFNLYVVAHDLSGGVSAYEFSVVGAEGLTLLSSEFVGTTNQGDVPLEYIVTTGSCLDGSGAFRMATLLMGNFTDPTNTSMQERAICLVGTSPSSFPAFSEGPGYAQCDGSLRPFSPVPGWCGVYPGGCAILNPNYAECPVDEANFGTLKATY